MAAIDVALWNEARDVLGDDLPPSPTMLDYRSKVEVSKALTAEGWPQRLIGSALGVAQQRISGYLRDEEPRWRMVAGRGPRPGGRTRRQHRSPTVEPVEPVQIESWSADDEPDIEPGAPWWYDDEDDDEVDELPAPLTTSRPKAKSKGIYGWTTPMVVARLRREGHEVDDNGHVLRWAWGDATEPQKAVTAAPAAPASVPPPPALRPPVMAPQRPEGSPQSTKSAAGTVAVELECGHVERDLPLNGPWVQRRWVACNRCGLAHRSIRRRVL